MSHNKEVRSIPSQLPRFLRAMLGIILLTSFALIPVFLIFSDSTSDHAFYKKHYKKNAHIPEIAYATLQSLYMIHRAKHEYILFERLTLQHVRKYPQDPNNGYYFLLLGHIAETRNAIGQALIRYNKTSQYLPAQAYQNLEKKNSAKESLIALTHLETAPRRSLYYNTLLLEHKQSSAEKSRIYYTMGSHYEKLGLWDSAYEAYKSFLHYQKNASTKEVENDEKIRDIHFRLARRNVSMARRIWDSAESARRTVSYTLLRGSAAQLHKMRTPSFFIVEWDNDILKPNIYIPKFKIHAVLKRSNIYMEPTFNAFSTYTKKFWRVTGWDRVSEWFFVFQQIYQPDIPAINGSWEWAGIYLGSKSLKPHEKL